MASLPDDHPVWRYMNPTEAHCFITGMVPTHIDKLNEFISWYDKQIQVVYEMKQKGQTNQNDEIKIEDQGDWGVLLLNLSHGEKKFKQIMKKH